MIKFEPTSENKTQQDFRLAHISDPHLSNLSAVTWQQLLNKRILGYLSWRISRRHIHRRDILKALIANLDTAAAHHLVISGDLTHIGTPVEYQQVRTWLKELGSGADISVIPGNHDAYIRTDKRLTTDLWSDYMDSDAMSNPEPVRFPSLRRRGPLAIIGVSSAVPTAPFFATGRVGQEQMQSLSQFLKLTREQGLFRVVLIHHGPLADSNKYRKRLIDSREFRSIIKENGAELVLHGHGHYPVNGHLEANSVNIPVVGAPSASLLSSSQTKRAGYNIYHVKSTPTAWLLQLQSCRYDEETKKFIDQEEWQVSLPRQY